MEREEGRTEPWKLVGLQPTRRVQGFTFSGIMNTRYFDIAKRMASESSYYSGFRLAAVFVPRTGHQYSAGVNSILRTHPRSNTKDRNVHAELAALINFGLWNVERIRGGEMYVVRLANYGMALSKPCDKCEELLKHYRLRRVHYTTINGYETMRLS